MPGDQHHDDDADPVADDEPRDEQQGDGEDDDDIADDDDSVEQILEDAGEMFGAEDERTEPVKDADAPPPG